MNTKIIIKVVVFLLFAGLTLFAQDDTSTVWGGRYAAAQNMEQKYDILSSLVELRDTATVPVLLRYLKTQNDRKVSAVVLEDYRVILTTIRVLGDMRNPIAAEELTRVLFSEWTPAIDNETEKALIKVG